MSTSVLVLGATGVIGRRVVPALLAAGAEVTANVRDPDAARRVDSLGARAVTIDLFDRAAVRAGVDGFDAVVNLATSIPSGMRAARPSAWKLNDRLRSEAAANVLDAIADGGRYVGESITLPYASLGDEWIDETGERIDTPYTATARVAEAAACAAADRGVAATVLRFAMYTAADSGHTAQIVAVARRGWWAVPGPADSFISLLDPHDAAAAVVAALDAPSGIYNVAEPDPRTRGEHAAALAAAVGRGRLRRLPRVVERAGGAGFEVLARSQRVSSARLTEATGWRPRIELIDQWERIVDDLSRSAGDRR